MKNYNNVNLLPTSGELRATVFFLVGSDGRMRSRDGWWRLEGVRVVGRKYRGRNTFVVCGVSDLIDVVPSE